MPIYSFLGLFDTNNHTRPSCRDVGRPSLPNQAHPAPETSVAVTLSRAQSVHPSRSRRGQSCVNNQCKAIDNILLAGLKVFFSARLRQAEAFYHKWQVTKRLLHLIIGPSDGSGCAKVSARDGRQPAARGILARQQRGRCWRGRRPGAGDHRTVTLCLSSKDRVRKAMLLPENPCQGGACQSAPMIWQRDQTHFSGNGATSRDAVEKPV